MLVKKMLFVGEHKSKDSQSLNDNAQAMPSAYMCAIHNVPLTLAVIMLAAQATIVLLWFVVYYL